MQIVTFLCVLLACITQANSASTPTISAPSALQSQPVGLVRPLRQVGLVRPLRQGHKCRSNEFTCADKKQCVYEAFVCDGGQSCQDGSDNDKTFCANYTCPRGIHKMTKCADGIECVLDATLCDGSPQCNDGSDDALSFCKSFTCPIARRKCADGSKCIRKGFWCDGHSSECPDGSDEANCGILYGRSCANDPNGCRTTLTCINNTCSCLDTHYFSFHDDKRCLRRIGVGQSCNQSSTTSGCDSAQCMNGKCTCLPNQYHDKLSDRCLRRSG